ncbi:MAG TPA: FprA family A-type flavoprotein [Deltaproteobacteria bacterium]|nr:FprA family A-type flavoprotein [Deltaproteobacteria bacterium]HPP80714.1 FprA family A-type flavoprotein [Deltaproteobacteria bacterium]
MTDTFKPIRVSDKVYWVGAVDWTIRDFHGYTTKRGSTYNAYLILADKVTLVDTVKAPFLHEMMARISNLIDPRDIDIIISNHSEMDHSGSLREVVAQVAPEQVIASVMGAKALKEHHLAGDGIVPVKDGQDLSLGNMRVRFMETRMLHWPDSMFTYLEDERILFSQDAFGMHLATGERFADEIDRDILRYEAATYYANILLPYSGLVLKLLDRVAASGMDVSVIAPDHGPIWRTGIDAVIGWYRAWAQQKPTDKAVVVYGTMWHSTELMARAIEEGLLAGGARVKVMSMEAFHRSDVAYEVLDAGALFAGSSTLNNNMLPAMADVLTYLKGLRPANLVGAAFGSYGWSGEAAGHVQDILAEMKVELVAEPVKSLYVPDDHVLRECFDLGMKAAQIVRQKSGRHG